MQIFPSTFLEKTKEFYLQEVSIKSQIIFTSIILFFIASIASLPFIYVDTYTQARGIIKTQQEHYKLTAPLTGEVLFLNLTENQKVKFGDTLLIFNSSTIEAEITARHIDQLKYKNYIADLRALTVKQISNNPEEIKLHSTVFTMRYNLFLEQKNEANYLLELANKKMERSNTLFKKEFISSEEYENAKYELDRALSKKEQLYKTTKSEWEIKLKTYEQESRTLKVELKRLTELRKKYIVLSPTEGTIQELQGIQPNSYLTQNQFIANISPNDSLIVEVYVTPRDIGFIRNDQNINIQIDAYNYREWGVLKGKVLDIGDDAVNVNNSYFFKVRCKPDKTYLQLNNNFKGYLKKGMTLTTNFLHNKRSLYNLLFDKIDDWINPQSNKQN